MLETLRIKNYALIDEVEVDFRPGFNALTGETGAGKSILVGALNLVLGARASGDVLRSEAKRASIDAVFRLNTPSRRLQQLLDDHAIELEEGALLLSRTLSADGRSRAYAGGKLAPLSLLAALGDELVDLHGQHEHQSLLKPERQLDLLDAFAHTEAAAEHLAEGVAALRETEADIARLESGGRERARQIEFLRFEVNEIGAAGLTPDEEEELEGRINLISNAERIYTLARHAYGVLYENEEGSAIDAMDGASKALDDLAEIDGRFAALGQQLAEVRGSTEAVAAELRSYAGRIEYDPQELEELNQRRALLANLKRKYGRTIEEILAYRDKAAAELAAYDQRDERLEQLRSRHAALLPEVKKEARQLSKDRRTAARRLDKEVAAALQELGMKGARFTTHFEATGLGSRGVDHIQFLLAANEGEKLKPLRQVASGGEVSRIMLALKAVFAEADKIPALIFDEIDAGVGGAVAHKVADKFRVLAQSHQIICVTHIPQIAAAAQAHFRVSKRRSRGRSITEVAAVDGEERIREMARLLDGSVSQVSLTHARDLLAGA